MFAKKAGAPEEAPRPAIETTRGVYENIAATINRIQESSSFEPHRYGCRLPARVATAGQLVSRSSPRGASRSGMSEIGGESVGPSRKVWRVITLKNNDLTSVYGRHPLRGVTRHPDGSGRCAPHSGGRRGSAPRIRGAGEVQLPALAGSDGFSSPHSWCRRGSAPRIRGAGEVQLPALAGPASVSSPHSQGR